MLMNPITDSFAADVAPAPSAPFNTASLAGRTIRHDGWTPEKREDFLEALRSLTDVGSAAAQVGMSRSSAYALRQRDPDFARAWDEANQSNLDYLRGLAFASAIRPLSTEKYDRDGNLVMRSEKPNDRMLIFLLNKYDFHAFHDFGTRAAAPSSGHNSYDEAVQQGHGSAARLMQAPATDPATRPAADTDYACMPDLTPDYIIDLRGQGAPSHDILPPDIEPADIAEVGDSHMVPEPTSEQEPPSEPERASVPQYTIADLRAIFDMWLEMESHEATARAIQLGNGRAESDLPPAPVIEGHIIRGRSFRGTLLYDAYERQALFLLWCANQFGIGKDCSGYPHTLLDALDRNTGIEPDMLDEAYPALHNALRSVNKVKEEQGSWTRIP